jgi:transposase
MKKILKQVAGIDVAQDELVVSLGRIDEDLSAELYASKSFPNHIKGFETLQAWVKTMAGDQADVHYVMEATGVYHEKLAYYLSEKGCILSVVLPNKISNYLRTLEIKTITDKTASQAIALFGLQRKLDEWKRPDPLYKKLRQLTREREQLVAERTMIKNQLHAEGAEAEPGEATIKRMKKRIVLLDQQEKEIKTQIQQLVKQDEQLKQSVKIICTIPGVGTLTAVSVLAETNGFELIGSRRQLTSYAGLDVKEKQSGTSVKGKARISKKGNKYLRKAMHMPALTAIRHDERFKSIFARLVSRHGIKMKAVVAVQRKLLEMIYTVYKTNTTYDPQYLTKKIESN